MRSFDYKKAYDVFGQNFCFCNFNSMPAVEDVTGAYPGEGRDAARYDWLGDSWPGWGEVWLSWPSWVAPVWVEGKGEETWDGGKGEV